MTLFPGLFSKQAIADYAIDMGKEIIYARGTGRIEAVTSSPRALEGGRPSLVVANETHHWIDVNDGLEMAEAIRRNLAKSRDGAARIMEITNAHLPGEGSVAEATYDAWVNADGNLPGVYYDSVEVPVERTEDGIAIPLAELSDETIREGLIGCRGDSTWVNADSLLAEIRDPTSKESISRRFYLNQVTPVGATWLPPGAWEACEDSEKVIPDASQVVLGFDGSRSGDTTVLVVVSVEDVPHLDVVGWWEKPADENDWKVPRQEVKDAIRDACRRWTVTEIAWDEYLWLDALEELEDEGLPCVTFPQNMVRMGPATQRFYEDATGQAFTHSGHKGLTRHVANAHLKTYSRGSRLTKDRRGSPRKIDAAVAAVMALERAAQQIKPKAAPRVWSMSDLLNKG